MATALISGLMQSAEPGLSMRVADPSEDARTRLKSTFGVMVCRRAMEAAREADVIVLAVKPQVVPEVLKELAAGIDPGQLIVSIAAGTTMATISASLGPKQAIIRSMPNTPALVQEGISVLCAGTQCRAHHRKQAERVLRAVGKVIWIEDESLMDAVTAISGSGPAYFFLLTEALAEAGVRLGLPEGVSRQLAEQTCVGAGAMLSNSDSGAAELRGRVTSPGGTTQAALEVLTRANFAELMYLAAAAAERRGNELSQASA